MKYTKRDHCEVSDGDTKMISSSKCPLTVNNDGKEQNEILDNQLFKTGMGEETIMCQCLGQGKDFQCPYFFKAVYSESGFKIDCRHPMMIR